MNKTALFSFVAKNNGIKLLLNRKSEVVKNITDKKLEYYRKLNATQISKEKPTDWFEAKAFKNIPGPKPLPLIGNAWRFFIPKYGDFYGLDLLQIMKKLHETHGDIAILQGLLGQKPLLLLFNPKDFEKLHRNEGAWPCREAVPSFTHYTSLKKDALVSGLVTLQGEEWFKFRTVANPIFMQPKNVEQYTDKMNLVVDELVGNIRDFAKQNSHGQMPDDFQRELCKWALESVAVVTMDTHLGCLKIDMNNEETQKLINCALDIFKLMYKLDMLPSVWKIISTPTWREYVEKLDYIFDFSAKYVNKYLEKIEKGEIRDSDNETTSMLLQMVRIDKHVATVISVDTLLGGVDTTSRILAAALYYLARYPEKQNKLREEVLTLLKTKECPVTNEILKNNPYMKAVIKETTRLAAFAMGNMRTTTKDLVLAGYQVPAGTRVTTNTLLLCQKEEHFIRAKEFLPERWIEKSGELSHRNTNPRVFAPFGYGPRGCIGKRLANFQLETTLLKIIRNFELKWPHEDMVFSTTLFYGIAQPLRIHVKELDS